MKKIKRDDEKITFTFSKSTFMLILGIGIGLLFGLGAGSMTGYYVAGLGTVAAPSGNGGNDVGGDVPAQRVQVSLDDDPVLGDPDAPVTIIEFSDYECPFCQKFWSQTLPQIKENYIDTGKVKLVYRDFPLSFHPGAKPAAAAAHCAGEQNEAFYWEAHDLIFENQGSGLSDENIFSWVSGIEGIDSDALKACIDSGKYDEEIDKDFADGQKAGVKGTPSFFVGNEKDGYVQVEGAQPYAVFEQVLNNELNG